MNLKELEKYQKRLAKNVILEDRIKIEDLRFVAGVDQAFVGNKVISACVC